ncbi:MAG: PIN domain-containing protein [Dongiaceae bacterium]
MIGVDTNVLVRYVTRDDRAQATRADRLLDARSPDDPAFVNRIVLCELAWVLHKAYEYDRPAIAAVIEGILSTEALVVEDRDAAIAALASYWAGEADLADGLIGITNLAAGCTATATFDQDAARLAGFRAA